MKNTLSVILQNGNEAYFWVNNILDGIFSAAEKFGVKAEFYTDIDDTFLKNAEKGPVIVVGSMDFWLGFIVESLSEKGFRPVILNAAAPTKRLGKSDGVFFDLTSAVKDVMNYFALCGKRKTALLGINPQSSADRVKKTAFSELQDGKGSTYVYSVDTSLDECIEIFMSELREKGFDSVLCANDTVATNLVKRLDREKIKLPDELFIIGMGNSLLGRRISRPLTSVNFDYTELGRQGFYIWRTLVKTNDIGTVRITLDCTLEVRESTAGIPFGILKSDSENRTGKKLKDSFYEDKTVLKTINAESVLLNIDEIDMGIIDGILRGLSDTEIAGIVNITDRAVRYRIKKLQDLMGVSDRNGIMTYAKENLR